MRALGRALRVDLHRSVCSRPFFVTVALLFTWLVANCGQHLTSQMSRRVLSAAEMLNYTLTGTLSLPVKASTTTYTYSSRTSPL